MNKSDFYGIVDELEERIRKDEKKRFSEKVLKEAGNPHNVGKIEEPDCQASITGPCGDTMEFSLTVEDGRISDIRFMTDGCGSSIASGSITTRMVKGRTMVEASKITDHDILNELDGLPEENRHCTRLAADTLHKAIENYPKRER